MSKKRLVVSSGNINKIKEIKDILKDMKVDVVSKDEIGLKDMDVVEDGSTLEENSIKKAVEISKHTDDIVIADDSGLFVNILNGEPGVYSSRYAGEEGNDKANIEKLLNELRDVSSEKRTASFKTCIAIVLEDKSVRTIMGECTGKIITEERGKGGFGYDPLFIPDGYDETFSELEPSVKNAISHRAEALKKLKEELIDIL